MRGKMPNVAKMAVSALCATLLLGMICTLIKEASFIRCFLAHATGLNHKAVILAEPIVKMAAAFINGMLWLVLVGALAFGKSWARKTYIVKVILSLIGTICLIALVSIKAPYLAQMLIKNLYSISWWAWLEFAAMLFCIVVFYRSDVRTWYREDASAENRWGNRIQCLVFWAVLIVAGGAIGVVQHGAKNLKAKTNIVKKFPRLRVAELEALADLGDAPSMWRLGNWERNGWLGEKHPDKAFEWYKKAADLGDRGALNDLGDCFEKGIGTATNLEEAVSCWMKAAEKKHGWAACKVAIRYQKDKKQKEAFEWFRKSADIGSDYGCCKLGECYEKGWGTETNAVLAAEWFLKGAERNHGWGMEKTGDFYRDGYGVEKDLDEAQEWYEKAVRRGNKNAKKKLDALRSAAKQNKEASEGKTSKERTK